MAANAASMEKAEELRVVHAAVVDERIKAVKELYDEKLLSHEKLVIEKFVAIYREWNLKDAQLVLQAKEYERRLEGLNHEAQRILEVQQRSISADKFDGTVAQNDSTMKQLKEELRKQIETTENKAEVAEKNLDEKMQVHVRQLDDKIQVHVRQLDDKIAILAKQVYIITGGIVVIEFILKFLTKVPVLP